ncbi:HAD family hydrolase [Paenibacillus sp. FSL K6-2524]|uniref:HAD family hydrolase n=1 Tax=Paenibacillus sp. FSL K6-2524 TaxID=2954516 RepID=UPI0030FAE61C
MKTIRLQQILFDLDDTLIHCNKYFELILSQFADIMVDWFQSYRIDVQEIRSKQIEIDVEGVSKLGFASLHFPQSLIDTYRYFCFQCGRDHTAMEEEILMKLGMSVYDLPIEPYPGMVETLDHLQEQGHELSLYTGGESVIQRRKIEQMKLSEYFQDRIYIRQHKNVEALEGILQSRNFERKHTWMIGNSLRTDIMPAISAGINTVYIKLPDEWTYNIVELKKDTDTTMYTVSSLEDVPRIITESMAMAQH